MIAQEKLLHIDIPAKLTDVKMVFRIGILQFEGDLPALCASARTWCFDVLQQGAR